MVCFMSLINLTPHDIVIFVGNKRILIPKSDLTLRVKSETISVGNIKYGSDLISITETKFLGVDNLPEKKDGVFYIVSLLTCQACPDRDDFLIPNESVRDENGLIIGCKSLSINPFLKNGGGQMNDKKCEICKSRISETILEGQHVCLECWLSITGDGDL